MAQDREEKSREDLTEEASPYRVEEYRRKGIVAQSKEVSAVAAFIATICVSYVLAPNMGAKMMDFMKEIFRVDRMIRPELSNPMELGKYMWRALLLFFSTGVPICIAGFIVGALGSFVQIGSIFSFDPITPAFEKINPLQGFFRLISFRQLQEFLRILVKSAILLAVCVIIMKSEILTSAKYAHGEAKTLLMSYAAVGKEIFSVGGIILVVFAAIDFGLQKMEFSKSIKMTKQEAKQEHREREGDPQIRARVRAAQRDLARKRMMDAVKKADVIVTNPTHIAIALSYDKSKMAAPKVVGKGADFLALKIKEIAAAAGVPMVENVPLARTLYKSVKLGQAVPRELYQAVAEVLAYVYRLRNKKL